MFMLGMVIGMFIGAWIGILVIALMSVASKEEK